VPSILNIGGGTVAPPLEYRHWDVTLLDIDEAVHPDICLDARELTTLEPGQYDAVYASHVVEHFAECDVDKVLWGFYHILKPNGFADIHVPDAVAVMKAVVGGLGLNDVLYTAPVGPIRACDVLWGWQAQIKRSGLSYYAHRFGFSRDTLGEALHSARFEYILIGRVSYGLHAMAYKRKPKGEAET
jgi:hypothetical protein